MIKGESEPYVRPYAVATVDIFLLTHDNFLPVAIDEDIKANPHIS